MEKGQDDVFKSHLNKLDQERARMAKLLEKMTKSAELIGELQSNFQFVNSKTEGLQNACEQLLNEQKHLETSSRSYFSFNAFWKFYQISRK